MAVMKWVALTTLIAAGLVHVPSPVVRVSSGLLRGRLDPTGTFYQYLGVPYGTVNDTNRFKAPLPPPTWKGVYDAIEENTWCPQKFFGSRIIIGSPDCLKLNIYAPVTAKSGNLLPVMVFIHGGIFVFGAGSRFLYGGDYFTEHGVIFIGINYRLNVEGFLCLGIKDAPGNAGLRDQIAALEWIKSNIKVFGGDMNNITLFGESAGAASVGFLMNYPAAKGLFHKVILQSGSILAPWVFQVDPLNTASNLVKELGYNTRDPHEIYNILSKKSHHELLGVIHYTTFKTAVISGTLLGPCIENDIDDVDPIITQYSLDSISSRNYIKVPMIIGSNDMEGLLFVGLDFHSIASANLLDFTKDFLNFSLVFPNELEMNKTAEKLYDYYFSSKTDDLKMSLSQFYSDFYFKYPSIAEMELYARTMEEPMYYYIFQYSGYRNLAKFMFNFFGMPGATHVDELFYMPRAHVAPFLPLWFDRTTVNRMLTMWTNFAKYGDPTPETTKLLPIKWLPSREWNPRALVIDRTLSTAPMWDERTTLWNDTYNKYRKKDFGFVKKHK